MKFHRAVVTFIASGLIAASANAADVCGYTVTTSFGLLCPATTGSRLCISVSSLTGNCDRPIRCYGGANYFCDLTASPLSGPDPTCPSRSQRLPLGLRCAQVLNFVRSTATPAPPEFTFTPSPTGTPTGTAAATITPTQTETPETPVGAATGTLGPTGTPTGTSAATVSSLMKELAGKFAAGKFRVP